MGNRKRAFLGGTCTGARVGMRRPSLPEDSRSEESVMPARHRWQGRKDSLISCITREPWVSLMFETDLTRSGRVLPWAAINSLKSSSCRLGVPLEFHTLHELRTLHLPPLYPPSSPMERPGMLPLGTFSELAVENMPTKGVSHVSSASMTPPVSLSNPRPLST